MLTPLGIAEKVALTGRFLSRKMREYERIRAEIEALRGEMGGYEVRSDTSAVRLNTGSDIGV